MSSATPGSSGDRGGWRKPLAAVICALWVAGLAWLAIATANPVTVNLRQIHQAAEHGAIVSVQVLDAPSGVCKVGDVLVAFHDGGHTLAAGSQITVSNLSQADLGASQTHYILPIVRQSDSYRLIPIRMPRELPLVYLDTADSRRQIAAVLEGRPPF